MIDKPDEIFGSVGIHGPRMVDLQPRRHRIGLPLIIGPLDTVSGRGHEHKVRGKLRMVASDEADPFIIGWKQGPVPQLMPREKIKEALDLMILVAWPWETTRCIA